MIKSVVESKKLYLLHTLRLKKLNLFRFATIQREWNDILILHLYIKQFTLFLLHYFSLSIPNTCFVWQYIFKNIFKHLKIKLNPLHKKKLFTVFQQNYWDFYEVDIPL